MRRHRHARRAAGAPLAPWRSAGEARQADQGRFRDGARLRPVARAMSEASEIGLRAAIRDKVAAAGTSFYWAMRLLPEARRDAMYAIYAFCREVDDIADDDARDEDKRVRSTTGGARSTRSSPARAHRPLGRVLAADVARFDLRREDFLAVIDGMEMDAGAPIDAPSLAELDLYCDRVASAVGRLSVRVFGVDSPTADARRVPSRPRVAAHQHPARPRRGRRARPALSAARVPGRRRHRRDRSRRGPAPSQPRARLRAACRSCREPFRASARRHGALSAPADAAGARHGRGLSCAARAAAPPRLAATRRADQAAQADEALARLAPRPAMTQPHRVHVVGAGLAGLAAALTLAEAGVGVVLHEAAPQAGGRCRSYFDATLGCRIDNGNHLLIAGNRAAMRYLARSARGGTLTGPREAAYPFLDRAHAASAGRLRPNAGKLPWWMLVPSRRVKGTGPSTISRRAISPRAGRRGGERTRSIGVADLSPAMAALGGRRAQHRGRGRLGAGCFGAGAARELGRGRRACIPLVPREGLSESLIDPALAKLRARGAELRFGSRLRAMEFADDRAGVARFRGRARAAFGRRGGGPGRARAGRGAARSRSRRRPTNSAPSSTRITASPCAATRPGSSASSAASPNGCSASTTCSRSRSAPPTGSSTCRPTSWRRCLWHDVVARL